MNSIFRHRQQACHPERSEGSVHSFPALQSYIGPSGKERALDDRYSWTEVAQ